MGFYHFIILEKPVKEKLIKLSFLDTHTLIIIYEHFHINRY